MDVTSSDDDFRAAFRFNGSNMAVYDELANAVCLVHRVELSKISHPLLGNFVYPLEGLRWGVADF